MKMKKEILKGKRKSTKWSGMAKDPSSLELIIRNVFASMRGFGTVISSMEKERSLILMVLSTGGISNME